MLKIENLCVSYHGIRALQDVSLDVKQGEIVSIIGSNGAGKSTLVRTISGLLKPDLGKIVFNGENIENKKPFEIVKKGLSQIPEGRLIFGTLSVRDNLLVGAYSEKDHGEIQKRLNHVHELFPILKEREHQRGGTLSGGQQQMLAIARALMNKPKFLILDEPSLGIAPNLAKSILQSLHQLRDEGVTIMLIEQAVKDALLVSDRGYVIQTGRIVATDDSKSLLQSPIIKQAYLGI
ncbi:MAG TPA: ABC transporter ATP-binding protein [Bellilinea sp.]|nr:ABC transporter ATP-binding protein [Bellilinea sp.]